MSEYQGYKTDGRNRFFTEMADSDEKLHPIPADAGFEWTETNMFGFNIPEHNIDCLIYLWHHPVLKVTYGGVTIWQGIKRTHMEAEALDFRSVMPMPEEPTDATYPNGLTIKMVVPQKEFRISYQHVSENTHFDLTLTAAMPPAVRYTGNHLTQMMKTRGELVLQGTPYKIDGLFTRDRSWGEHRTEKPTDLPPLAWMVGTFDQDFAFHAAAFENREPHPEWNGLYPMLKPGANCLWGYVRDGGKTLGVTGADLHVERQADGLTPAQIHLVLRTEDDRAYLIEGRVKGLVPQPGWPNMFVFFGFTEWTCRGKTGYGDIQDVTQSGHMRRFRKS